MKKWGPLDLVFRILIIVGIVEFFVMYMIHPLNLPRGVARNFVDAALLAAISAPLLYMFVVRGVARRLSDQERLSRVTSEQEQIIRAMEENQELHRRLLSLVNTVPGAIYQGHRDWSISFVGAEVTNLTGYSPEEFKGGAILWKDLIHPDDLEWVKETLRKATGERAGVLRLEYRIRQKGGDIRWVADRRQVVYDESGSFAYVDGLLLDITERKASDRRLTESEYRFRTIADTAPDGMITVNSGGVITFFNRAAERQFGYASEEVVGKNVSILIPERFRDAHKAGMERILRTGESRIIGRTADLVALRKDGSEFPIGLSLGTWGPPEAPFFSAIVRDITERKKAEEELLSARREAEEERAKTEAIIAAIGDGISIQDRQFRILYQNKVQKNLVGDHLGRFCYEAYENMDRVCEVCPIAMAYQDGGIHTVEKRAVNDRGVFHVEITASPLRDASGEIVAGIEVVRDITARRRSEETQARLAMAVEQSGEMIVVTDMEGNIEYINPAFHQITGYSREEVVGRNMRILKSGKHDETFYEEMWATISRGDVWKGRFVNRKKDGTLYDEEATISPVRDLSGRIVNFVAGKRDITREIVLQKQVQTAQRMESVGTLAGGIAHDFNNALTGVLGYSEMLRRRVAENPDALQDLDMIGKCAEQAATLTRQLLTFARRQTIEPVNLDLNVAVADMLKLIRKVIGEHIEIRSFLAKDLPVARVDRGQLEQVVMNLCLNARDAMPSGGQLQVETGEVTLDVEYRKLHPYMVPGRYVVLVISDTGIGMDDNTRERVFEPFFTTKPVDKGTGLGLSVVYGIVKQHDGYIHVYSEPGKGSSFKVYFPAVDALPDAERTIHREGEILGGTETILLAEDEEAIWILSERVLRELGYTVLVARNGKEAVDIFRQNYSDIDLALLDVVMPGMGGKEAYENMRKTNQNPKVIFMSGYSANAIHESYVLSPEVPFLPKPFGPEALARKVREVLDNE